MLGLKGLLLYRPQQLLCPLSAADKQAAGFTSLKDAMNLASSKSLLGAGHVTTWQSGRNAGRQAGSLSTS